ncbi:tetratricopeptide repeat protein [Candidatus Acetothermia bacterium]|nr:tetratricopeptide repeat protein [Candidatus Acetothermia bacterium]
MATKRLAKRRLTKRARQNPLERIFNQIIVWRDSDSIDIIGRHLMVYLIALLSFAIPLAIWEGSTDYGYVKSILALVSFPVLLILWALLGGRKRSWQIRLPWVTLPFALLVGAMLLSLINAMNMRVVLQSLALVIVFFIFYLLVVNFIEKERDIKLIFSVLLFSAVIASAYGLLQYLGILPGPPGAHRLSALISTMGNRNFLGGFLSYLFLPAFILLLRVRHVLSKLITLLAIMGIFYTILFVEQMGIRVGLFGAVILLVGVIFIWRVAGLLLTRKRILATAAAILLFIYLFAAPTSRFNAVIGLGSDGTPVASVVQFFRDQWERNAGRVRAWNWWVGWEMFRDNPIIGVGLGNYKLNFLPYKAEFLATERGEEFDFPIPRAAQAHNEIVQITAELGVVGLLAALAAIGTIIFTFVKRLSQQKDAQRRLDLLLLGCGITAFFIHSLVSFPLRLPASSLVLVLAVGLAGSLFYGRIGEWKVSLCGWPRRILISLVILFSLFICIVSARDFKADLYLNRGIDAFHMGHFHLAYRDIQRSHALDFAPRQTYFHLAMVQLQLGRYEEAKESLKQARTRFVTAEVFINLANIAVRLGDIETARMSIDLLLATVPFPEIEREARFLEAAITLREGYTEQALASLERLRADDPGFTRTHFFLGEIYRQQGRYDEARKSLKQALTLIEQQITSTHHQLAAAVEITVEQFGKLRRQISNLTEQKEAVQAVLEMLPPASGN